MVDVGGPVVGTEGKTRSRRDERDRESPTRQAGVVSLGLRTLAGTPRPGLPPAPLQVGPQAADAPPRRPLIDERVETLTGVSVLTLSYVTPCPRRPVLIYNGPVSSTVENPRRGSGDGPSSSVGKREMTDLFDQGGSSS